MKDKPVILVVDDQPYNIELLEAHLAPQGYEIVKAANGEEALEKLFGNQIDLILLDVMMPGMDGFEVIRRVRQDNTHRLLPIIMVTALQETEDRIKGIEAGCDDFISKPVDKMELSARVRSLLRLKAYNDLMSNYRKELEAAKISAVEAREYAENIINTLREPLIALDQDLRVVTASRSFYDFFKVKPEDTIGQLIYDLGNKQWDIPKLRELLETILPQKTTFDNYEVEHDFATIGRRIMLLNARQVKRPLGKGRVILLAIEDITERKKAETELKVQTQQLEYANKELESFSYSVSHDLRAPLRAIEGYSQMFMKKYRSTLGEDATRMITVIRSNTKMMENLIESLLSLSKVQKTSMSISEINMDELAKEVWNEIWAANKERELELMTTEILPGYGDQTLIRQVLSNLISNAVKFTNNQKPGIIEMSSHSESDKIIYCLKDNGAGFDMAYYYKLFGVFQRLHSNEEFEGTGIGLATVRRIINRHGGRVWAESKVNEGATFCFSLPSTRMQDESAS